MNCEFCNREISKLGYFNHRRFCKSNPNRLLHGTPRPTLRGRTSWNRGLPMTDDVRKKISDALTGKSLGICLTPEAELLRKKKISETMKANGKSGGLRKGSGRGKQGYYKGYWCDSSWELAWVIFNLDNGINFERCTEYFNYTFNGKIRKYYPDFKIGNTYIEIKGYLTDQFLEKKKSFPNSLEIIDELKMLPILKYVKSKYGNDFYTLYEK